MKFAVAVHYDTEGACAAAVAFEEWDAPEPTRTYSSRIAHVERATPGQLDLRALPCILQLLREHALAAELLVIDGFVHLDAAETPGLGRHLHHALGPGCERSTRPLEPGAIGRQPGAAGLQ